MRCLNCGENGIESGLEICPQCEVHLPSMLRGCLPPGTLLLHGNYEIEYPLGRGGFGITYRALDRNLQRAVAIKEFFPQDYAVREYTTGCLRPNTKQQGVYQRGLERFIREGRLLASLNHAGIVKVYNAFQERETAYLTMELIDGITLRDELNRQPDCKLPPKRTIEVITKLVDALDSVHQQNVYHLDISPDNVMVTPPGRVILIDFGASRQGLSGQTTQAYKEAYAPPEVLNGQGMGAESDVFELGMMLWELLTGKRPPSAISRLTSVIADGRDTWRPIGLDEPWAGLVSGAICLKQQDRPQHVLAWWPYSQDRQTEERSVEPDLAVAIVDRHRAAKDPDSTAVGTDVSIQTIEHRHERIAPTPTIETATSSTGQQRPMHEPMPITVYTDPERKRTAAPGQLQASFGRRLAADTIDRTILIIGSYTLNFIFATLFGIGMDLTIVLTYYVILGFGYCPTLDSGANRGTIGKQLMKIRVTDLTGKPVTFQKAVTRHACKICSYLTLGGGFLMLVLTRDRQTLHDRLAKCTVLNR